MGTNYYWYAEPPCPQCGHQPRGLHIGKSSAGWCFALATHPDEGINDLPDWEDRWKSGEIRDEYGRSLSSDDMRLIVLMRASHPVEHDAAWLRRNHAVPGPFGLVRHKVDGYFCIAHSADLPYDLMRGEFS